ncbi:MAG: hypothetical protein QOF65_1869 [Thermoleophilaceae bacterium]|jgi:uncharacterized Ntn-hydrolase superfamily protein|nr:hypothetical protein [Thermoleophilaceae bacterium]MEA2437313.1 hypothetical protein [Thermoleophilaceae bacterium]
MRRGTYSIVARDPDTGELGVAAQSHYFAVGALLPWAEAGVGAVATQSLPEPSSGATALQLMRDGLDAQAVLDSLLASDPGADVRQIAVVDAAGRAAVHTGPGCIPEAGHQSGDGHSCQASMMLRAAVPAAMAAAYEAAPGPLGERLMAALDAAEAEGGDLRGRQSAALLVVGSRKIDLRVDDHPEPLAELRRLHALNRAYRLADQAEDLVEEGRHDEAARLLEEAVAIAPDNDELLFWAGLATARSGDIDGALERVRAAAAFNPRWRELLARLGPEVAPAAAQVRAALDEHERSRSG